VVDVLVPEQEITSGVLQLVVIEGRLGDVIVEGAGESEGRSLARQIRTERGDVIRESDITEDLNWINKHPNRQVDLVFSPGDGYGETDVILRNESGKDLIGYVSLENSGNSELGEARGIFGLSMTGPLFLGQDSILSYQFTTNMDGESSLFGHSGVFATYLPWRHQITLLGAYVDTDANLLQNGAVFENGGENKQLSGRYGIPLPSIGRLSHELELGMDFKSSNNALAFNQAQVFDTTSEIVQYSLGYNIVARDQTGAWRLDSEVVNSPGDNTNKNTDAVFNSQRAGATANYTYGLVTLERDQRLPQGWTAYGRIQGQGSNANLLASETLGGGGYDSVRGWEERVVRGDAGVVATAELRTPIFYPSTFAGFANVEDGAYGLVFYDYGSLSASDPQPGNPDDVDKELGSVGMGFRYQRDNWFSLRVDYGFQVTEEGFEDGNQGRWHVGATATF
jgi:hemolysin activation/secretion protein